jgi:hypothetical protein
LLTHSIAAQKWGLYHIFGKNNIGFGKIIGPLKGAKNKRYLIEQRRKSRTLSGNDVKTPNSQSQLKQFLTKQLSPLIIGVASQKFGIRLNHFAVSG